MNAQTDNRDTAAGGRTDVYVIELIEGPADGLTFEAEELPTSLSVWREYSEDGSGLVVADVSDPDSPEPPAGTDVSEYRARFASVYTSLVLPPTVRLRSYDHVREPVKV